MTNKTNCAAETHERAATVFGLLNGKILSIFGIFVIAAIMLSSFASAANQTEIDQAIEKGVVWLATQQNTDGSWGTSYQVGYTGFATLKLCTHNASKYSDKISKGLNYIFANAHIYNITNQTPGNPDSNNNSIGVAFYVDNWERMYEAGIAMMAISECACANPNATVNVSGSAVNGWTYKQVLQDAVDYIAWGQNDDGGWRYQENYQWGSDNSVSGYVVLGLGYAGTSQCEPTIPDFVNSELNRWIDYIQTDISVHQWCDNSGLGVCDGGSGYSSPDSWVNILKTGNLLYEMAMLGDNESTQRVQDAINYIVRRWNNSPDPGWNGNPADYQAMYATMKGLVSLGINNINGIEWFDEFSDVLVAQQNSITGAWDTCSSSGGWNSIICTEWALLTLQKGVAQPRCGDGNIDSGEECDDGNNMNGDGCSHDCKIENNPPVADAGTDQIMEQTSHAGAYVTLNGSGSYDPDGDNLTYNWTWVGGSVSGVTPTVTFPLGTTTVTLTVFDGQFYDNDTVNITVQDTTLPNITTIDKPIELWPPNHKYNLIKISDCVIAVTDICDAGVGVEDVVITSVSSDEPEDVKGEGDGNTLNDIVIVDPQTVNLRAERQGNGNGRVYTLNFNVTDASGNTATGKCKVSVRHDQKPGHESVDDGPIYVVQI